MTLELITKKEIIGSNVDIKVKAGFQCDTLLMKRKIKLCDKCYKLSSDMNTFKIRVILSITPLIISTDQFYIES